MKQMIKLALVLAAYTVVACLGLALVYNFTKPYITAAAIAKTTAALKKVFPAAESFTEIEEGLPKAAGKVKFKNAYVAVKGGKPLGITVTAKGPTFDHATILLAIDMDRNLKMIEFLELTDTPGFGSKAADEPFIGQFNNKSIAAPFVVGDDVVAISGATVTSRGVAAILQAGVRAADTILQQDLSGIIDAAKEE